MQFLVKDLKQDVVCITVLDRDYFSPNGKKKGILIGIDIGDIYILNYIPLQFRVFGANRSSNC